MNNLSERQKRLSIVLKLVVIVSALVGTFLSAYAGRLSFMGSAWWIMALLLFLVVVGNCYLAVADLMFNRCKNK